MQIKPLTFLNIVSYSLYIQFSQRRSLLQRNFKLESSTNCARVPRLAFAFQIVPLTVLLSIAQTKNNHRKTNLGCREGVQGFPNAFPSIYPSTNLSEPKMLYDDGMSTPMADSYLCSNSINNQPPFTYDKFTDYVDVVIYWTWAWAPIITFIFHTFSSSLKISGLIKQQLDNVVSPNCAFNWVKFSDSLTPSFVKNFIIIHCARTAEPFVHSWLYWRRNGKKRCHLKGYLS